MKRHSPDRSKKTVAVVVPWYNKTEITSDEEVSFRHLFHFLGRYDKYLIIPQSLDFAYPGLAIKRFNDRFFGSARANTRLMLSSSFYRAFVDYKYVLIYQSDALVFSDQLQQWCETDLDYVGAPWIKSSDSPTVEAERVGNGGFSLRKVESFLHVFHSPRYTVDPEEYWARYCASNPKYMQYLNWPKKYLKRLRMFNGAQREMARWHEPSNPWCNEDYWWSDQAVRYYPEFKVASVQQGLRFSFEVAPRKCFELNGHALPFGCHAWPRYDRAFWEPYLLK